MLGHACHSCTTGYKGPGVPLRVAGPCGGWPLARVDLRAHSSLGRGLRPPRDPLGPAAFGYLSGSSILLRSRSLGAAMADAPDPAGKHDAAPAAATPPDQGSAMELGSSWLG